jgi:hypothetical protein
VAKSNGLGDNFYVGGHDLSGDIQALSKISGGPALIDVTDITQSAHSRLGGLRDGAIDFTSYFDPTNAHPVLSALPTADTLLTYARGTTLGNPGACLNAKQINYDPTRTNSGELTVAVQAQANSYGLEWGTQLTAGLRTDTAATNGASVNFSAATSFGFQAYLQVTAFTGTDVTIALQDSADNTTFAALAGGAFTQITAAAKTQRIAVGGTATVRQYVRAVTSTSGGFTSVTFNVVLVKNKVAVTF